MENQNSAVKKLIEMGVPEDKAKDTWTEVEATAIAIQEALKSHLGDAVEMNPHAMSVAGIALGLVESYYEERATKVLKVMEVIESFSKM